MPKITKQWRQGGDEDKHMSKLIKKGTVNKYTKPLTLKTDHAGVFGSFSENVIRNHLNDMKRKKALYLDGGSDEEFEKMVENNEDSRDAIDLCAEVPKGSESRTNIHHNYPVLCQLYKDPDNQFDKVVMAVSIPSGAQNVRIELNEDGLSVHIKYTWPRTMFHFDDLFKKQLDNQQMNIHHPKILCLNSALEGVRSRVDAVPESLIKVQLPVKVQTAIDSWSKAGIRRNDGTNIVQRLYQGVQQKSKRFCDCIRII